MSDADTSHRPPRPPSDLLRHGLQVLAADTAIATFLWLLEGGSFGGIFVVSNCIGFISWGVIEAGRHALPDRHGRGWPHGGWGVLLGVVGTLTGYLGGTRLADVLLGQAGWTFARETPIDRLKDLVVAAFLGTLVIAWFYGRARDRAQRLQVQASAHEATEARLRLLQSQLEPHMLFNTLANLRALITSDPPAAQAMLDHLIDFLRSTLLASRASSHTLRDEFQRIDDYLALMRVRMGGRLQARTQLPEALAQVEVPPLLLQPLVENAIRHGLEPHPGAGELEVSARAEGPMLCLVVEDSGQGLDAAAAAPRGTGFGLAQVRERLRTLHAGRAGLNLGPRPGGGTRAEVRLPLDRPDDPPSPP